MVSPNITGITVFKNTTKKAEKKRYFQQQNKRGGSAGSHFLDCYVEKFLTSVSKNIPPVNDL
jgi:hypothetical protein